MPPIYLIHRHPDNIASAYHIPNKTHSLSLLIVEHTHVYPAGIQQQRSSIVLRFSHFRRIRTLFETLAFFIKFINICFYSGISILQRNQSRSRLQQVKYFHMGHRNSTTIGTMIVGYARLPQYTFALEYAISQVSMVS